MAYEQCAACFGSGRGSGVGGSCVFCNGTGKIWVPDPFKPGTSSGRDGRPGRRTGGASIWDGIFEDNFAMVLALATWAAIIYFGLEKTELQWYWPVGGGLVICIVINWLFSGPLRFISTIVKYVFYGGLILGFIYLIYYACEGAST